MPGKRERLARFLDRSGALRALLWLRERRPSSRLTVITYHRVSDPARETRFDPDVIDATPEQFDRQLTFLTRHFNIIGIDELLEHLRGGPLPPNAVLLTFDDGYRDCLDVAVPILERHGARAVFFIATAYTEKRRLFWWDRIAYILRRAKRGRLSLDYPEPLELSLGTGVENKGGALPSLLRVVKRHVGLDLERFLAGLTRAAGLAWDRDRERELADELIMTWDDVATLAKRGMDVQSHTRTHRVLDTLSRAELEEELSGSRRDLREHVGGDVRALAYPVGFPIRRERHIVDAIRAAGYQVGFTNATGVNNGHLLLDPFDVRRHAMEASMSDEMFRGIMALPQLGRVSPERR